MLRRFRDWALQLLIVLDLGVAVVVFGLAYLIRGGECPSAYETISSHVGRAELAGRRWGVIVAAIIDRLFILLGAGPDHCRRNVVTAYLGQAPKP